MRIKFPRDIIDLRPLLPVVLTTYAIFTAAVTIHLPMDPVYAQEGAQNQITLDEDSFWSDPSRICDTLFSCARDNVTGWNNNESMRLSTSSNDFPTWSWIRGVEITNSSGKEYSVSSHMRLNDWATRSHFFIDGLNETSGEWYQLDQCPAGINGPLNWTEFNCEITVPDDTTTIRPTLAAGWSSRPNEQAVTWYDDISITGFDGNITRIPSQSNGSFIPSGLQLPPGSEAPAITPAS